MTVYLTDENATQELGARLGRACIQGASLYLSGELGAGKTTLTRGFLRALGCRGRVKSPTYTLLEPYQTGVGRSAHHLDLYRVADPDELEYLGLRDLLRPDGYLLVEWPERAEGWLPDPDLRVCLAHEEQGRSATVEAGTARGRRYLLALADADAI